jgi:hypothetical protein
MGVTVLFEDRPDLLDFLIAAGPNGITAEEAALRIIGRATDNDRKTIRQQLARLVTGNMARKETGKRSGDGFRGDRWYATPQAIWSQREDLRATGHRLDSRDWTQPLDKQLSTRGNRSGQPLDTATRQATGHSRPSIERARGSPVVGEQDQIGRKIATSHAEAYATYHPSARRRVPKYPKRSEKASFSRCRSSCRLCRRRTTWRRTH